HRLLNTFGIRGRIYTTQKQTDGALPYVRKDGTAVTYTSKQMYDLRIAGNDLLRFNEAIGFANARKQSALDRLVSESEQYRTRPTTNLVARDEDGQEVVYNLTEPLHHSYLVQGLIVSNFSEYMSIDDSACNLASLNLMKFRREDGELV